MGRPATRTPQTGETLTIYANRKLKIAIKVLAGEKGKGMAEYACEVLAENAEIKKMMKKMS